MPFNEAFAKIIIVMESSHTSPPLSGNVISVKEDRLYTLEVLSLAIKSGGIIFKAAGRAQCVEIVMSFKQYS